MTWSLTKSDYTYVSYLQWPTRWKEERAFFLLDLIDFKAFSVNNFFDPELISRGPVINFVVAKIQSCAISSVIFLR